MDWTDIVKAVVVLYAMWYLFAILPLGEFLIVVIVAGGLYAILTESPKKRE